MKKNQDLLCRQAIQHDMGALCAVAEARHHDPFDILGNFYQGIDGQVLVYRPAVDSLQIQLRDAYASMQRVADSDFFFWSGSAQLLAWPLRLRAQRQLTADQAPLSWEFVDPYSFAPVLDEQQLGAFGQHDVIDAYRFLGAHCVNHQGVDGVLFSVWAPNAERVSVVGDWNQWDGRVHPMRCRGASGIWEIFLPELGAGVLYKFELRHRDSGQVLLKTDPYGRQFQYRPDTAAIVAASEPFVWSDQSWMARRSDSDWLQGPVSIYEVHLGSWRRDPQGHYLGYRQLAHELVDYVRQLGFTHIQLLPITEHPFDGSWGYQSTGYFAPSSRFGSPDDFRYFVDHCHRHGIGVILDWVPAHFPKDSYALANFDGSALYEHSDPALGEHRDWGTLIFNYGRREVRNFLLSSAHYWLGEFHLDGLRVDAVASMLYLDYSREPGQWRANCYGGNENLEAIAFIRELNMQMHQQHAGALIIAEESTAWPQVSRPVYLGGLGFGMKWNMGWMNDTLRYFQTDPVYRSYAHEQLTFGLLYAFSENFILPFSHDETVHGKRSILEKMPGDSWQQFANVRLLYTYLFTHPGKKLLFMGDEFAQGREWCFDQALDWPLLEHANQRGVQTLVGDLNRLYREQSALHRCDFQEAGFRWIDCHDHSQSVISFVRQSGDEFVVVVLNFTPVPRHGYRIGVPAAGRYRELLNSDSCYYNGSNVSNGDGVDSEPRAWMGFAHSIELVLPPLAGIILRCERG